MKRILMVAALVAVIASPALAVPVTFFGEDLGIDEFTPLAAHPNADAARNNFFASLIGVGTETFESFAPGTGAPLAINFGVAGTATLNGTGNIVDVPAGTTNGFGRYAISGTRFWEADDNFSISFSAPIAAFGFFGVDIGDFNGQVTVATVGGLNQVFNIGNTQGGAGGGVLFWGVISNDPAELISSITFGNTAAGTDFFAFDDMTIGSIEQVRTAVPEPGSMVLLGLGLAGLAAARKLRR